MREEAFHLAMDLYNQEIHNRAAKEGWTFYTYPMPADEWTRRYGFTTFEEVMDYLDVATWGEVYEERFGHKPPFPWHWPCPKQARADLDKWAREDAEREEEAKRRELERVLQAEAARVAGTRNTQMRDQLLSLLRR